MHRHRCGTHAHAEHAQWWITIETGIKVRKNAFLCKWLESRGKAERERREGNKTEVTGWRARSKIRRGRSTFDNKTGSSVVTRFILTKHITPAHYRAAQSTTFGKKRAPFFVIVVDMSVIRDEDRRADTSICPLLQSLKKSRSSWHASEGTCPRGFLFWMRGVALLWHWMLDHAGCNIANTPSMHLKGNTLLDFKPV